MAYAIIRRVRAKVPITQGDRRHCYDLLLRRGWSPRAVALCCWAATAVTIFLGWSCLRRGQTYTFLIAVLIVGIISSVATGLGSLRADVGANCCFSTLRASAPSRRDTSRTIFTISR
jgi:hypothetical protein